MGWIHISMGMGPCYFLEPKPDPFTHWAWICKLKSISKLNGLDSGQYNSLFYWLPIKYQIIVREKMKIGVFKLNWIQQRDLDIREKRRQLQQKAVVDRPLVAFDDKSRKRQQKVAICHSVNSLLAQRPVTLVLMMIKSRSYSY